MKISENQAVPPLLHLGLPELAMFILSLRVLRVQTKQHMPQDLLPPSVIRLITFCPPLPPLQHLPSLCQLARLEIAGLTVYQRQLWYPTVLEGAIWTELSILWDLLQILGDRRHLLYKQWGRRLNS